MVYFKNVQHEGNNPSFTLKLKRKLDFNIYSYQTMLTSRASQLRNISAVKQHWDWLVPGVKYDKMIIESTDLAPRIMGGTRRKKTFIHLILFIRSYICPTDFLFISMFNYFNIILLESILLRIFATSNFGPLKNYSLDYGLPQITNEISSCYYHTPDSLCPTYARILRIAGDFCRFFQGQSVYYWQTDTGGDKIPYCASMIYVVVRVSTLNSLPAKINFQMDSEHLDCCH